jgi:hypothetical protein
MTALIELHDLVREHLLSDPAIMEIAAGVFDRVPEEPFTASDGTTRTAYVRLGAMDTRDEDADGIDGVGATLQVDIWSKAYGSIEAKRLTDMVRRRLRRARLVGNAVTVNGLHVELVRVFTDRDGATTHGVVQVTAHIEEPA